MKKLLIAFAVLAVLSVIAYVAVQKKVGDIRPALLPPHDSLPNRINNSSQTGEEPTMPLVIPNGFKIGVYALHLGNARDLQFSPQGTLLVSSMKEGLILALPDKNKDGVADDNYTVLKGLNKPHGITFFEGKLFVAEETAVSRYSYDETTFQAKIEKKLFDLPPGGRHRTRSIVFDNNGNLFVSVGSTCDTCIEKHPFIGTVLMSDKEGKTPSIYSKGLRNAVFLTIHPATGKLWATEMGRDFLGDETPPDEVNQLSIGADYGWPFCYGNRIWDRRFGIKNQSYCNTTQPPFYEIPAHSAPLGITFVNSPNYPAEWQNDILIAYHGSWNRSVPAGYKVVRINTSGQTEEHDFITGFLAGSDALGRPVDLEFDRDGNLYISDDKAGAVYKLVYDPR